MKHYTAAFKPHIKSYSRFIICARTSMSFPVGPPRVVPPSGREVTLVQGTHWGREEHIFKETQHHYSHVSRWLVVIILTVNVVLTHTDTIESMRKGYLYSDVIMFLVMLLHLNSQYYLTHLLGCHLDVDPSSVHGCRHPERPSPSSHHLLCSVRVRLRRSELDNGCSIWNRGIQCVFT